MIQRLGDGGHLVMWTQSGNVVLHLFLQIALIQPRQARRRHPVALALHAVTGETGVFGAARPAAQRDHLSGRRKGAVRLARRSVAGGEQQGGGEERQEQAHKGRTTAYGRGSLSRFGVASRRRVEPQPSRGFSKVKLGGEMRRAHSVVECRT